MGVTGIELAGCAPQGAGSANRQAAGRRFIPLPRVCKSEHYRLVPDSGAGCVNVYGAQEEWLGAYDYRDLAVRQDTAGGRQFLISEHGAVEYDAMLLDDEMKGNLRELLGGEPEVRSLLGYSVQTHSGTGIQYLLRQSEAGRGGTVLLQSAADAEKFEALARTYFTSYPNLVGSMDEAYIWAELEVKGVAYRTDGGIVEFCCEGVFYHDNANPAGDWDIPFAAGMYQELAGWVQSENCNQEELQNPSVWQRKLGESDRGQSRERDRFWEKRKEKQEKRGRPESIEQKRRRASREAKARREQRRQVKLEQEHKRKRRARYVRIMEESSWKRKLQSQEAIRNYYQSGISAEVVSFIVSDRSLTQGRTEGCVRCTFAGKAAELPETVYFVYYSPEGLRCIREGERNPRHPGQKLGIDVLQWEIPLEKEEQYSQISEFLAGFPQEDNLRFAADEGFWKTFLENESKL